MTQTLWAQVSLSVKEGSQCVSQRIVARIRFSNVQCLACNTGSAHVGLSLVSIHGKHRCGTEWVSGHRSHCAAVRLSEEGPLQAHRSLSWLTSARFSYLFLLVPVWPILTIAAQAGQRRSVTRSQWLGQDGPISIKLSGLFFSLCMWAKQLDPWLLWKVSCGLKGSRLLDKASKTKG